MGGIPSRDPESIRHRIGVLLESLGCPNQVTEIEYLTFFGRLFGRNKSDAESHGMKLLEDLGLLVLVYHRRRREIDSEEAK